jgi:hypothetical protein
VNTASLLRALEQQGVQFEAVGGRVRWKAPAGVLTPEVLEELQAHRDEVLALVTPSRQVDIGDARALAAAWRGAASELGELAGYPRLPFKDAHAVHPGEAHWRVFVARASVPDLQLAVAALRRLLSATPRPED